MSHQEDDKLQDLREGWQRLATPKFEDADDSVRNTETERVVSWLQDAWQELEVSTYVPRKRQFSTWPRPKIIFPLAAAAILTALTIWAFFGHKDLERSVLRPSMDHVEIIDRSERLKPTQTITRVTPDGGLMVKKGRVRLILVQTHTTNEPRKKETDE